MNLASKHPRIYPAPKCTFSGWGTSSDLSILTHSLGTRTPTESTPLALLRWTLSKTYLFIRWSMVMLETGLDGRLQEVVLYAPSWPPQLRHWFCYQQAEVQAGSIRKHKIFKDFNLKKFFEGPPMQTILVVPEEHLPWEVHLGRPKARVCLWAAQKPHLKHMSGQLAGFSVF